jgi:hypothetical protein
MCGKSQPAMVAPAMRTKMFPMSPKPVALDEQAGQPAGFRADNQPNN